MTSPPPIAILGLTSGAFIEQAAAHGAGSGRAMDLYRGVFRDGVREDGRAGVRGGPDVPWIVLPDMPIRRTETEGATRKFTQALPGGLETESVILPQRSRTGRPRTTLCVSSQVGCAMGCTFCETARMGLLGSLDASAIVAQWRAARFDLETEIDNVVFMGMGEPLDNVEAVIAAIRVLADDNGPGLAPSRISVSTVGRLDGIARLAELAREPGFRQLRLAVSLNAPNDEVRTTIMPVNRAAPMARLMDSMLAWPNQDRLRILIEYVLIPGVNDAPAHAEEVCRYLDPLLCTINVIPYNPRRDSPWPAPEEADVEGFMERLRAGGAFVKRRQTMGRSVMGACGQLGNPGVRRRKASGYRA